MPKPEVLVGIMPVKAVNKRRRRNKPKTAVATVVTEKVVTTTPNRRPRAPPRRMASKKRAFSGVLSGSRFGSLKREIIYVEHSPETQSGIDFLRAAINPCGEDPLADLVGIPDGGGIDSALVKMRDDMLIGPPDFMDETDNAWSCIVFSTPYLVSQLIIIRFSTVNVPSAENLQRCLNAMSVVDTNSAYYPNFFRPTQILLGGLLSPYTGPPFEILILRPAALSAFNSGITAAGWTYFRKWRTVYKGHTIHHNAPDLSNEGRIITAATATESSTKNLLDNDTDTEVNARFSVSPPFADNVLAMQDVNSRQDIVKKGAYAMQRHWNSSIIWNEAEDVRAIFRVATSAANNVGPDFSVPNSNYLKVDGFDLNLGWIVENIRGINMKAEIHIKHRCGVSFNVPGTSPWAPFMCPPPSEDSGSMKLYHVLSAQIPHSFDSSFNDWGFLGGILDRVVGGLAPLLGGALQGLTGMIHGLVDRGSNRLREALPMSLHGTYSGGQQYGDRSYS